MKAGDESDESDYPDKTPFDQRLDSHGKPLETVWDRDARAFAASMLRGKHVSNPIEVAQTAAKMATALAQERRNYMARRAVKGSDK